MEWSRPIGFHGTERFLDRCRNAIKRFRADNSSSPLPQDPVFGAAVLFCESLRAEIAKMARPDDEVESSLRSLLVLAANTRLHRPLG